MAAPPAAKGAPIEDRRQLVLRGQTRCEDRHLSPRSQMCCQMLGVEAAGAVSDHGTEVAGPAQPEEQLATEGGVVVDVLEDPEALHLSRPLPGLEAPAVTPEVLFMPLVGFTARGDRLATSASTRAFTAA